MSISAPDAEAIDAVLARKTDAWNRHDMDAFVADTLPDVEWVNVVGMHWKGRDAVRKAHIAFHKGMFATSRLLPPDKKAMREIAPGVVIVVQEGRIEGVGMTPGGTPYPADGNVMTLILVKTAEANAAGEWRIAHVHNTNINAMAVAHDPAKRPD